MRFTPTTLLVLTAASVALAMPAPAPGPGTGSPSANLHSAGGHVGEIEAAGAGVLDAPNGVDLDRVDETVDKVDLPKKVYLSCTPGDRFCKDLANDAVLHGVEEIEGHLGKQEGHVTDEVGTAATMEGQPNLGAHIAAVGQDVKQEMQGRRRSELNSEAKQIGGDPFIGDHVAKVGDEIEKQGQVVAELGQEGPLFGKEAKAQFANWGGATQAHKDPAVDALVQ